MRPLVTEYFFQTNLYPCRRCVSLQKFALALVTIANCDHIFFQTNKPQGLISDIQGTLAQMNEHSDSKLAEGQKLRSNLAALHKDSVLLTKQKVFSYNRHNVLTSTDSLGSSAQIILLQKDLSIPIVIHNISNL